MRFRMYGKSYDLTKEDVEKALMKLEPDPIQQLAVSVVGRWWPVKQAYGAALGMGNSDFNSRRAFDILRRLGFPVRDVKVNGALTQGSATLTGQAPVTRRASLTLAVALSATSARPAENYLAGSIHDLAIRMNATLDSLLSTISGASLNDRIESRDELASYGEEGVTAIASWLQAPELVRFAVRVVQKAVELDGSVLPAAIAVLQAAASTDVPDEEVERLLKKLRPGPTRAHGPLPAPYSGRFARALYDRASELDPYRVGVRADRLYQSLGAVTLGHRDVTAVASALNTAKDLFSKVGRGKFLWRVEPRPGAVVGALSGRSLAECAWEIAREKDPTRAGLRYQDIKSEVIAAGDLIAGVDPGATMNGALHAASDLFDRKRHARGRFVWKPRAAW